MLNAFVGDLEWDSVETSDSEDQDDSESVYCGQAQSILSGLDESIGKIDDFLTYERGFIHGEVVCSIKDPSGQLGRVVNVDMTVDLETTSGELIKGVNSKNLLRLRSFACGDYVVHGPWIGMLDRVVDKVTVMFDDETRCEIMMEDTEVLVPVSPILPEDAPYPYYPGQRVRVKLPAISKSVQWLCGSSKSSRDEGTVCHVQVGLVHVNWIAMVSQDSTPPHVQDPKKLTLLSCFPHVNWQLGDWCTLPSSYFQSVQKMAEKSVSSGISSQCLARMKNIFGSSDQYQQQIYVISKTKSKVDVLWQNGSQSLGIDSQSLLPVNIASDHDFWPGQFVLKVISEDIHVSNGQRLGIVKYVDAEERTVKVKWMVPEIKLDVQLIEESNEEIVSAYELIEHPDYSYCIGDVVFRLLPHSENLEEELLDVQTDSQSLRGDVSLRGVLNSSLQLRNDILLKDIGNGVTCYSSCIGNVIGFKDAAIEVRWANGIISKVQPSELFGLDKLDDPSLLPAVDEESVPEMNTKKSADQAEQPCLKKEQDVNGYGEDCKRDVWDARLFSQAAIGFLTNVATSIFTPRGSTSLSGPWKGDSELEILKVEESELDIDDIQADNLNEKAEAKMDMQPTFPPSVNSLKFKQFDVVDDCSDHHFVNGIRNCLLSSQVKRSWLKKVQQEWSILRKNLPESIYVRVYEERIDILRACIVGAPGTPYHDGLFFFDIFFPPNYPQEPPLVHYNSGGLRLNPNLYESGKVCLSLLKTWMGSGTEVWDPESSTILQILISLQALVLNDKPYFNEAGYDNQIGRAGGEKNSITYNENAFLLSCKSMLYILHGPPKHFEALVEEHFTHRSHHILHSCKAYMFGAQVGCAVEDGKVEHEASKSSSTGFKIMLEKLFPKILSAFTEKGIDYSQFSDGSIKIYNSSKASD